MKSARRQAYVARKNQNQKKERKKSSLFRFFIPALLIVGIYLFIKLNTNVWNGNDKISVVYKDNNGDIGITILDPVLSETTTLIIPGDTQVDVARNYGTYRIRNVWQLGIDEKIGGSLLAETVTQNFLFPVSLWSSRPPGLDKGNMKSILDFVFFPGQTNISFCDRVHMAAFSVKMSALGRTEIDLGKSKFLDKKTLNDGQSGYLISGQISQRLTVYFSDNDMESGNVKVNISDATGSSGVSERLGEILEVMGGKIVSIDKKGSAEEIDCVVMGNNADVVKKIASLFSCKIDKKETSFDLDIKIGTKFAERF